MPSTEMPSESMTYCLKLSNGTSPHPLRTEPEAIMGGQTCPWKAKHPYS